MDNRQNYTNGLRELADWLDLHPEVPLPQTWLGHWVFGENQKTVAKTIAKALGNCEKEFIGEGFRLKKEFGPITLTYHFNRDEICERRVVGKKLIPEYVIREHEEEIVEWDCKPLFGDDDGKFLDHE